MAAFSVLDNLCGLSFAYTSATGQVIAPLASLATIFATGNGVPPMGGINIVNNNSVGGPLLEAASVSPSTNRQDYNIDGALCQRELMTGTSPNAQRVQLGVKQVQKSANLQGKPAIIVHGRSDTLVPTNFSSRPYYAQNKVRRRRRQQAAATSRSPTRSTSTRSSRPGPRLQRAATSRCTSTSTGRSTRCMRTSRRARRCRPRRW